MNKRQQIAEMELAEIELLFLGQVHRIARLIDRHGNACDTSAGVVIVELFDEVLRRANITWSDIDSRCEKGVNS